MEVQIGDKTLEGSKSRDWKFILFCDSQDQPCRSNTLGLYIYIENRSNVKPDWKMALHVWTAMGLRHIFPTLHLDCDLVLQSSVWRMNVFLGVWTDPIHHHMLVETVKICSFHDFSCNSTAKRRCKTVPHSRRLFLKMAAAKLSSCLGITKIPKSFCGILKKCWDSWEFWNDHTRRKFYKTFRNSYKNPNNLWHPSSLNFSLFFSFLSLFIFPVLAPKNR